MNAGKPSRLQRNLILTFVFTLGLLLAMSFLPYSDNMFLNVIMVVGLWVLFPTIAGFVAGDSGLTYYIPTIAGVVLLSIPLFPYRFIDLMGVILLLAGASVGAFFGFLSDLICRGVQSYIEGDRRLGLRTTGKFVLLSSLLLGLIVLMYLIYVDLANMVSYFDQHPWVITLVGIIVTAILAFLGRGYYEKRKEDKR